MEVPIKVPVMPLSGAILFPQAMLPLYIFEGRYRRMLADVLEGHRMFAVALQRPGSSRETPERVAGLGLVRAAVTAEDGTSHIILQGLARIELVRAVRYKPYRVYDTRPMLDQRTATLETHALVSRVVELVSERIGLGLELPFDAVTEVLESLSVPELQTSGKSAAAWLFEQAVQSLANENHPEQLADLVSATLLREPFERQIILETRSVDQRLRCLVAFLLEEIRVQKLRKKHE